MVGEEEQTICLVTFCLCRSGRSITPASYIIKPMWDIDWDIADFGLRSAEWHFTATRCLTAPLVVTAGLNGHWADLAALEAQSWKM